ncbi:MAG: UDP-N-acetylmuramoyl-tripeptide--D-alanyl-D-alanine ligase [Syntrophobacterales bacterium]|jgi:UDP-N-acetylmuramoyl-tripeptide--D-alanyl-D-alanine ligase|nr:UDP-N-acetylmuramoyl-tripeptide--D-alanyl-D-alanine ligase [Syntrophobacterales bacterium]
MMQASSFSLTVQDIVDATQGTLIRGRMNKTISGVSVDTRALKAGDLFVPLAGCQFGGCHFLAQAVASGAGAFLTERAAAKNNISFSVEDVAGIEVDDTLTALGDIARHWRSQFNIPMIAITGSMGKTATREMIAAICGQEKSILKTERNFDDRVDIPLTLLRLRKGIDLGILEMQTDTPGEVEILSRLINPDVGIITNIGAAYPEGFGTIDELREEKWRLFEVMDQGGTAIFNLDNPGIRILAEWWRGDKITCSLSSAADITASDICRVESSRTSFRIHLGGKSFPVVLPVLGRHNVRNALLAVSAARALGYSPEMIVETLNTIRPFEDKLKIVTLNNGTRLIQDSHAAMPLSGGDTLRVMAELSGHRKRIVFLNDMLELGEKAAYFHEDFGRKLAWSGVHVLFLRGEFSQITAQAAMEEGMDREMIFFVNEPQEAMPVIRDVAGKDDWILLKGFRDMNLNELLPAV